MPGRQIGNQFSDFDRVDWPWSRLKKRKISLMLMSRDFFLEILTTVFMVIRIDSRSPSDLNYLMLMTAWTWARTWLVIGRLGRALNKIGRLLSPF